MIPNAPTRISAERVPSFADAAAQGILFKISRRKRFIVKVLDAMLKPLVRLVDRFRSERHQAPPETFSILIFEYWNLGDIVMESPFLENLRLQYPSAHIVLMTSPKCVPLLQDQGVVDELIVVRVPWAEHYSRWRKYNPFSWLWLDLLRVMQRLHSRHFDLAFTARADIRENFMLWLANVRRRVGYGFGGGSFMLTDIVSPDLVHPHFSNRWLRLLEHVGKPVLVRDPHLRLKQHERDWAAGFLRERGIEESDFVVAIHTGARSRIRQWGEENFTELAKQIESQFPVKIVWFRDPGQTSSSANAKQLALSLPLRQFMAVLQQCRVFVCNDSGPMHIATALNVAVVAVFGPTQPAWFGPLGHGHRIVIRSEFWCRPCFDYCQFDEPYCLRTISVDAVFKAVADTLGSLLDDARTVQEKSAC